MTKEEYLNWKATRGSEAWGPWDLDKCCAADALIKAEALKALEREVSSLKPALRDWIMLTARTHYGSMETDDMLTALGCYPEWL